MKDFQSKKCSRKAQLGRWTHEEHLKFLEALKLHGKDWIKVKNFIGTRTSAQSRSHAQKFFSKLQRRQKFKELAFFNTLLSRKGKSSGKDVNIDDNDMSESINLDAP